MFPLISNISITNNYYIRESIKTYLKERKESLKMAFKGSNHSIKKVCSYYLFIINFIILLYLSIFFVFVSLSLIVLPSKLSLKKWAFHI